MSTLTSITTQTWRQQEGAQAVFDANGVAHYTCIGCGFGGAWMQSSGDNSLDFPREL